MAGPVEAGLRLGNIPIYNLLHEFVLWNKWIRSEETKQQFVPDHKEPIRTPLLIWGGMPEDLLTLILQRTVLGLESYVSVSVWLELGKSGRLTPELNRAARNPFSIQRQQKGTAYCYYNALPGLIASKYALQQVGTSLRFRRANVQ